MAGVLLLSQALTVFILAYPLVHDSWIHDQSGHKVAWAQCRAASICLGIHGLTLTLVGGFLEHVFVLALVGTPILALSSISLMISFWPAIEQQMEPYNVEQLPADDWQSNTNESNYQLLLQDEEQDFNMPLLDEDPCEIQPHRNDSPQSSTSRLRGTRRLLQLASSQVLYLYIGCALLLVRLPFSLCIPHFVATALSALAQANFEVARAQVLYLLVAGSIDALLDFWCVFLFGFANQRIVRGVRLDLFAKLIRQEVAFFDEKSTGELTSRLTSDWYVTYTVKGAYNRQSVSLIYALL
jgi:ABC-type multidrug transport system fused ATPase/permease subunit